MASSSTPFQPIKKKWDVFISFRGKDIRRGFLSFLFRSLKDKGIDAFKDENLRKGAQITPSLLRTIQESCISIVIFSENYADSPWCLDELVQINECWQKSVQTVMPVFYRINPTDVQELRGKFAEGLEKLEKEHHHKLPTWRNALEIISNELVGWVTNEFKDEETLVQSIVDEIWDKLDELNDMPSNDISHGDKLVGMESRVEEVKALMNVKVNDRRTIGIWGMPGIGKTTLAGEVYHQMKAGFDSHCFVFDVNDRITKEIPINLRDEIIGKLLRDERLKIGTPCLSDHIKRRLGRKKVLLIMDDVAVLNQLSVLAGDCNLYGEGSRIIVTCTDRQVLVNVCDREHIYEVKELDYDQALQLFCLFAFHSNEPKEGFEGFSKQVIRYANGNPLVLRVLGPIFCGRDIDFWESKLANLQDVPDKEILKVLRESYEDLERNEQCIFLDIACFLLYGFEKDEVVSILEGFGLFAKSGIRRLLDKSLCHFNQDRVYMHKLLEQMGKEIVNEECKNVGGRSRLWSCKDILQVFETNSGTENIMSISLDTRKIESIELSSDAFSKMHGLRFLRFYGDCSVRYMIPDGLDFLPKSLTYFDWSGYPFKSLPLKFRPKNLVQLLLDFSHLEQLWCDRYEPFENLKALRLSFCESLKRISNTFEAPKLEELCLQGCENLVEIPSLVHFESLQTLQLSKCLKLKQCPDVPCNLKRVYLDGTPIKQLPSLIGNCCQLVELWLRGCRELENLPDCIGQLKHLTRFEADGCLKLSDLPSNFGELRSLKTLSIKQSGIKSFPSSFNQLRNLKLLECKGCEGLTKLPLLTGLNSLERLYLDDCGISEIPESISTLISLSFLSLSGCKRLRILPELPKCLTSFDAYGCTALEFASFPSLSQGENEYLDIGIRVITSGKGLINFGNCTNLNKEARLKIMEDALSYSYSNEKREFILPIPGVELCPKMRYKTSGGRISLELERHHRIIGFYFSVVIDPQLFNFDKEDHFKIVCDASFVDAYGVTRHSNYEVVLPMDLCSEHVLTWYQTKWNRTFNPKEHFLFTHATFEFCCENKYKSNVGVIGCGVEPRLKYLCPREELM